MRSGIDFPASEPRSFWELDGLPAEPTVLMAISGHPRPGFLPARPDWLLHEYGRGTECPPFTELCDFSAGDCWPLWPGWAVEKSPGSKQCILHTAYFLCLSVARRVGRWGACGHRGADLRILGQESDRDCQAETSV